MMTFSPLNDVTYETAQKEIGYGKLFPYILEDFVTRKDMMNIMRPDNLPVNTTLAVTPGQAVTGTAAAGAVAAATVSPGSGTGSGVVTPVYIGEQPSPASAPLTAKEKAVVDGGGRAAGAALGALAK